MHITFTGHRAIARNYPSDYTSLHSDLRWGPVCAGLDRLYEWIKSRNTLQDRDIHFHNGGAMGFDLASYYTLIRPSIPHGGTWTLHLAWPGYWNPKWNRLPNHIQQQVRSCYSSSTDEEYGQSFDDGQWQVALKARNVQMVQHLGDGDCMIAMWDGAKRGGTWHAINEAVKWRASMFGHEYRIFVIHPMTGRTGVIPMEQNPDAPAVVYGN